MKIKKQKIIILTIAFIMISTIFLNTVSSKNYSIDIENIDSKLIKKEGKTAQTTFLYYEITVKLKNTGAEKSDNLTVIIIDDDKTEDYPGTKTRTPGEDEPQIQLQPGESQDFIFGKDDPWPIQGDRKHTITIIVYPNNNESATPLAQTTHTLNTEENNDDSIPGFELVTILISSFLAFFIYKKRKYKRR